MSQDVSDFAHAVLAGDTDGVERALAEDPDLAAARNDDGVSLVCIAIYMGHRELAARLARDRDDLDVFEAACLGDLAKVRAWVAAEPELLTASSPDGFHALGYAAFFGHRSLLAWLVESGAPVDRPSANAMSVQPLHSAVAVQDPAVATELAKQLLDAGADANARQEGGNTPLHEAAFNGNVELVALLLARGADASAANEDGARPGDVAEAEGFTELAATLRNAV